MSTRRLYPLEYLAIMGAVGLVGLIVFPLFSRARESDGPYGRCSSNLKQIGLAFAQYSADYDGFLPSMQGKGTMLGWADALVPYTRRTTVFQCPANSQPGQDDPTQRGYTDYWFNARISGRLLTGLKTPSQTLLVGDGDDGGDVTDARYALASLPPTWRSDTQSPLFRHLGMAWYVFADGHAKMFPPQRVDNPQFPVGPTFAP